jgi:glycine cleavage system H protein
MTRRFEVNVPADLAYTREHEWLKVDDKTAVVGITDWAQGELGDIVFVELSEVGTELEQMGVFGTIEAVKAVSELYSPVKGKVIEVNSVLEDDPMVINSDPYGDGWMIKVELDNVEQLETLLTPEGYKQIIAE